jgi:hypothetical protein
LSGILPLGRRATTLGTKQLARKRLYYFGTRSRAENMATGGAALRRQVGNARAFKDFNKLLAKVIGRSDVAKKHHQVVGADTPTLGGCDRVRQERLWTSAGFRETGRFSGVPDKERSLCKWNPPGFKYP